MREAILGVDYGRKRIGVAISEVGFIARPLTTFESKGDKKNILELTRIVSLFKAGTVVFGLPVHKNMAMANEIREFAKGLMILGVTIDFQDEMLSSVEAEEYIRTKMGITDKKKIANMIDSVAAAMILRDYLEKGEK